MVYNNTILIVTRDGVLHKIRVDTHGELASVAQQQVLGSCMAAPTVVGSTAVLCGTAVGSSNATALVLVNLETFKVEQTITQADGIALPQGGSAASALVSTQPQVPIYTLRSIGQRSLMQPGLIMLVVATSMSIA